MEKLVVIDGNSILNRAFYGILENKMLQTEDGKYTNAVYGFLNIMFKIIDDINPEYLVVAFDLKDPTKRHLIYKEYKGTRKPMPNELAEQMPIIKEILRAMRIKIIEKEGYEADDVLGTLSRFGEENNLKVTLLTGDRDSFQLATKNTIIRIPRTKQGKTEIEDFDEDKIIETYGILPKALIDVKGLMGDASDNIPGVPGIGEKTALNLIKENETIENIYKKIEENSIELKPKVKENLINNKELAFLSKELGTIDVNAEIEKDLKEFKIEEWNKKEVLDLFKKYRFKRFIERFDLTIEDTSNETVGVALLGDPINIQTEKQFEELKNEIINSKKLFYFIKTIENEDKNLIIKEKINKIIIWSEFKGSVYTVNFESFKNQIKELLEAKNIEKYSYEIKKQYILLKQEEIEIKNIVFDIKIAGYLLNSNSNQYSLKSLASEYLELDLETYINSNEKKEEQTSLFDEPQEEKEDNEAEVNCFAIYKLYSVLEENLKEKNMLELFEKIEMPTAIVLAKMQYEGVYVDEEEINIFGDKLKKEVERLKVEIYELSGEEFNINSTKQLGEVLFEKLKLPVQKKT